MRTKEKIKTFASKVLDLFFPKHIKCIFCGEELNEDSLYDTCAVCQQTLPFITRPCLRCGSQLSDSYSNVCHECYTNNRYFREARSVIEYTDKVVSLVHKFKYNSKHYLAEPMLQYMGEVFSKWRIIPDIVCDVPIHANKMKRNKKNHSSILASGLAEMFGLEYLPLCEKVKDNFSQTELTFEERQKNVSDAYIVKPEHRKQIKGKTILIVDDVITTCATINEIAKTLLHYGASEVYAISFAHTQLNRKEKLKNNK